MILWFWLKIIIIIIIYFAQIQVNPAVQLKQYEQDKQRKYPKIAVSNLIIHEKALRGDANTAR